MVLWERDHGLFFAPALKICYTDFQNTIMGEKDYEKGRQDWYRGLLQRP